MVQACSLTKQHQKPNHSTCLLVSTFSFHKQKSKKIGCLPCHHRPASDTASRWLGSPRPRSPLRGMRRFITARKESTASVAHVAIGRLAKRGMAGRSPQRQRRCDCESGVSFSRRVEAFECAFETLMLALSC